MKKLFTAFIAITLCLSPRPAKADMFGGDVVVLTQILANAVQQLMQLRQLLAAGQDSLSLMRDVNRGLNDALGLFESISATRDPGLYKEFVRARDAFRYLESVYGKVAASDESQVQRQADQSVAEAIALNNSIYEYSKEIDRIGDDIKRHSTMSSPKGAQKLTAQSMGVVLHVLNQALRAQATGLKLQAQSMAIQNRKDKQFSEQVRDTSETLNTAMTRTNPKFRLPRL